MKRLLPLVILGLSINVWAEPPSAGWNFGTDTYSQHVGSLVLNSLSDRYGISTFDTSTQHLGTNDYIEENAVKNQLAINGYSKAWDYNPTSQTGYGYSSVYNQPLPNLDLTKLSFMGLDGDPTKQQNVYVLTSEYNRLSDQGQANSIDSLNASLNGTALALNQTIAQTNVNTQNIGVLATGLDNETQARIAGDNALQGQLDRTNGNVAALDNRISNLERLKVMPEAAIRFYDAKHVSLVAYDDYDATNGRNFAVGVRVQLKLGKSYEEKRIDEQDKQISDLKALLTRMENIK